MKITCNVGATERKVQRNGTLEMNTEAECNDRDGRDRD